MRGCEGKRGRGTTGRSFTLLGSGQMIPASDENRDGTLHRKQGGS